MGNGGIFWEGLDIRRVAYRSLKEEYILGGGGAVDSRLRRL